MISLDKIDQDDASGTEVVHWVTHFPVGGVLLCAFMWGSVVWLNGLDALQICRPWKCVNLCISFLKLKNLKKKNDEAI